MSEQKETLQYIWDGMYPTWNAAAEAASQRGDGAGLRSERWMERIKKLLLDYRAELKSGVAMPPRQTALPLICALRNPQTIVDFGGSSGWCWDYLNSSLPTNAVTAYQIVETAAVVDAMNASCLQDAPVAYFDDAAKVSCCDLLYVNSVLQYFPSNESLLAVIEKLKPSTILLEDLVAIGKDDFFTVQQYFDSGLPYRFLGLTNLISQLQCAGYQEIVRYPYASPILGVIKSFDMSNFPTNRQLRYSLTMLFEREKTD